MKVIKAIGGFLKSTGQFIFCFRKVFLAIPVIVVAILLARHSAQVLPAQVGLILASDGTFSRIITREQAIYGPLLLTAIPLVCMALSRKTFYPWLISVITLAIPPLLLMLNQLF
ncbi:MAG: hypothetical protein SOY32_02350 [Candidatus Faecousia sp.]|nr:hypothetical protein [Clostridiales bacterium]MDD7653038.1 hypothetical protein [Bacillota bacterium]MDY4219246.1 hypothetical protein [Candidatus Faecousia sp.]